MAGITSRIHSPLQTFNTLPINPISSDSVKLADGSILHLNTDSQGFSFEIIDQFGIVKKANNIIFANAPAELTEKLIHSQNDQKDSIMKAHLLGMIKRLRQQSRVFSIQIIYHEKEPIVVIAPYGLAGGGLNQALAFLGGGALSICGVALLVCTGPAVLPFFGAVALGAGVSGTLYSIKTKEEDVCLEGYLTSIATGAVSGAVSAGIGALGSGIASELAIEGANKVVCATVFSAIGGACSGAAAKITQNTLSGKDVTHDIQPLDLVGGAVAGGCASLATTGAAYLCNEVAKKILLTEGQNVQEAVSKLGKVVIGGIAGGTGGAAGGATAVLVNEVFEECFGEARPENQPPRPSLQERVIEAAAIGSITGAVIGALQAAKEHDKYVEEKKKEEAIKEDLRKQEEQKVALRNEKMRELAQLDAERIKQEQQRVINGPESQQLRQNQAILADKIIEANKEHNLQISRMIKQKWKFMDGPYNGQNIKEEHRQYILGEIGNDKKVLFNVETSKRPEGTIQLTKDGVEGACLRKGKITSIKNLFSVREQENIVVQQKAKVERLFAEASRQQDLISLMDDPKAIDRLQQALKTPLTQPEKTDGVHLVKTNDNGVVLELKKGISLNQAPSLATNGKSQVWDDVLRCLSCSEQVYMPNGGTIEGMTMIAHISQSHYQFDMYAYLDTQKNDLILAFKGTDGWVQWTRDNSHLCFSGVPKSVNSSVEQSIQRIIDTYPTARITVTGHSLGASIATFFSSRFKVEAICFDNPGVRNEYDTSRVTSFQTIPNPVNQLHENVGNVIQMATETSAPIITNWFNPLSKWTTGIAQHTISYISDALHRTSRLLTGGSSNWILEKYIYNGSRVSYQNRYSAELKTELRTLK